LSIKLRVAAGLAAVPLLGGIASAAGVQAASAAPLVTQTCNSCVHVQNVYAFRGALDAKGAGVAVNTPMILWPEQPSTTDSGADLLAVSTQTVVPSTTLTNDGTINQSTLNWYPYEGDTVVRFKYDPFGNNNANTYVGLNGTKLALRADNPDSVWQSFIEVPVTKAGLPDGTGPTSAKLGGVANACGPLNPSVKPGTYCVLIDVGQTQNTADPMVVTDPGDAFTGSGVQQDVEFAIVNQNGEYGTNQVDSFQP
jgi:hypothetical protein